MDSRLIWTGRALLGAIILFAALGVVDPEQRLTSLAVRGDRIIHGLLSYALTLAMIASFPKRPAWVLALAVVAVGVAVEAVQSAGLFAGDSQLGDVAADLIGCLLALGPVLLGKARAGAKLAGGEA